MRHRSYAFASSAYSTPILDDDGKMLGLDAEKKTRELTRDLKKLHDDYKQGSLFFVPPIEWALSGRFEEALEKQGVLLIPDDASRSEIERIKKSPDFYLNFIEKLKSM